MRVRLGHDDRRLLFEWNHQPGFDFGVARLKRLNRGERVLLRRSERVTKALHHLTLLRDGPDDHQRDAWRNVGRNRETKCHARDDACFAIAQRLHGNRELVLLIGSDRR